MCCWDVNFSRIVLDRKEQVVQDKDEGNEENFFCLELSVKLKEETEMVTEVGFLNPATGVRIRSEPDLFEPDHG